ncbi:hypothetical protein [Streptomyces violaceorubidus]|uniref:hypothetical protein n=1 Tax=Streptomyces violaceorubidus TaxID=284042 RepID=UPI000AC3B944|nr:hypothetical protein [Streptomyces violaceorubidus]
MTDPTTETARHLWDYDHPYYCAESNYFQNGQHARWDSWQHFAEETLFVTGDRELNLLFRWDWQRSGNRHTLLLFFVIQRKGLNCSHEIEVTEADEPAVRRFLEECGQTLRETWEPMLPAVVPAVSLPSADQTALTVAEAVLAVVETALGDTLVPAARAEALAGIAAVLPTTTGQTADERIEQAEADAELHARNTLAVARERDTYRKVWKEEQERRVKAEAAVARVRRLHDALDEETALTSPDDEITRGAAARKIAAALDGWTDPALLRRMADETPAAETKHRPRRGDEFEAWLKTQRDACFGHASSWAAVDGLLDQYRLHADTGTPLCEHVCEGQTVGDCECLEQPAMAAQRAEAHAEGEHAFCGPECDTGQPTNGARQDKSGTNACTCGDAGESFRPAGHYADCPAAGTRQAETAAAPCVECDHPKTAHGEGDDPVTPGQCADCPDDEDRHDYQPAAGARQDGVQS